MKSHLYIFTLLVFISIVFSCGKDDDTSFPPNYNSDCVEQLLPILTEDSFRIYPPSDTLYGKARALKLYEPYCFGGRIDYYPNFDSYIIRFSTVFDTMYDDVLTEIFDINFRVLEEGCYNVTSDLLLIDDTTKIVHAFYSFYESDVILNYYDLKDTSSNLFEISLIDSVECVIEGKFDITFLRDTQQPSWYGNPNFLRFINGEFKLDFPE